MSDEILIKNAAAIVTCDTNDSIFCDCDLLINGPEIKDSFSNFERIISGVPHRITTDERSELSRIVRGVAEER